MAGASVGNDVALEDVDLVRPGLGQLRTLRRQRRVSSIVCPVADRIASRCDDRHLRRVAWAGDLLCVCAPARRLGLTGLEPVTLRLSSACSNQLSYRPGATASPLDFRFPIADFRFGTTGAQARIYKILNRQSPI